VSPRTRRARHIAPLQCRSQGLLAVQWLWLPTGFHQEPHLLGKGRMMSWNANNSLAINNGNPDKIKRNLYWLPIVVGFVIAIFAPTDVLNYEAARSLVNFVSAIVPMMGKLNGQYELAHVAQLFFAAMWLLVPFSYIASKYHLDKDKFIAGGRTHKILVTFGCVFLFPLMVLAVFFIGFDPTSLTGREYVVLHTRMGMATYGWVTVHGCVFGLRITVMWKNLFWDIYFEGSK